MRITPDEMIFWQSGFIKLNATIVFTWVTMIILVVGSWVITRRLSTGPVISRWQSVLETLVEFISNQIREITRQNPEPYVPFIGTLFVFVGFGTILGVIPGFQPPSGSLSTTTALAVCVFIAVPLFGIAQQGIGSYLKGYLEPSPLMLPFNIIGDISRTLALAVRLYGNIMSGTLIVAILLGIVPILFPIIMQAFGLLTGLIQAYIFAVLATVYIASGTRSHPAQK